MSRGRKRIAGVHIQWPWSRLILSGKKTVETRHYPLPLKHVGQPLAIIETPGPRGKREAKISKSMIVGVVVFSKCYAYRSRQHWESERKMHLVPNDDQQFGFRSEREKWAWRVESVEVLSVPRPAPAKRGIVFANNCKV